MLPWDKVNFINDLIVSDIFVNVVAGSLDIKVHQHLSAKRRIKLDVSN